MSAPFSRYLNTTFTVVVGFQNWLPSRKRDVPRGSQIASVIIFPKSKFSNVIDKIALLASELVAVDRTGFIVRRLRHLQAKIREHRRIRYTARMLLVGKLLARKALESPTRCSHWDQFFWPVRNSVWWRLRGTSVWFFVDGVESSVEILSIQ